VFLSGSHCLALWLPFCDCHRFWLPLAVAVTECDCHQLWLSPAVMLLLVLCRYLGHSAWSYLFSGSLRLCFNLSMSRSRSLIAGCLGIWLSPCYCRSLSPALPDSLAVWVALCSTGSLGQSLAWSPGQFRGVGLLSRARWLQLGRPGSLAVSLSDCGSPSWSLSLSPGL
jgi:hypothetical protein